MQAATGAPASGSVAAERIGRLLRGDVRAADHRATTGRTAQAPQVAARDDAPQPPPVRDANAGAGGEPAPQRAGVTPPRSNDMVEVVIRDRFGRPIRVERVDRRRLAGPRGYPPPHRTVRTARPYGPYGPYRPLTGARLIATLTRSNHNAISLADCAALIRPTRSMPRLTGGTAMDTHERADPLPH